MSLVSSAIAVVERAPLPDAVTRTGVNFLVGRSRRPLAASPATDEGRFLARMDRFPIAQHADAANEQHYELPPTFFAAFLGPRRKYSCCLYPYPGATLAEAEDAALDETIALAGLADGHSILELGCGWGSLSLRMAARFPNSRITALSNSQSQRIFLEDQARARGLGNLAVVTADMNAFDAGRRFDRIVSVEMFEHMLNWRALLAHTRRWLVPEGRLFLHVFTHRSRSCRFDHADKEDWIGQHFFTGGVMPAHDLPHRFASLFEVEQEWRWSGEHYRLTALDWLANFDQRRGEIEAILTRVYGTEAALWRRRWRLFFLAKAGLFGQAGGSEWGVGVYRLAPAAS